MAQASSHDIVVIGGSAGALKALRQLLKALPTNLPAAIFVTIHIPNDYPSILPDLLSESGGWQARHPTNGEQFRAGDIFVAPPDRHLILETERVVLSSGARENRHRPAIDVMFRSAARTFGSRVVAILLSGLLDDGSSGLMAVKMKGGITIVQDPSEAAVPEMPTRAIEYAHPDHVFSISQIAEFLGSVTQEGPPISDRSEPTVAHELDNEIKQASLTPIPQEEFEGAPSVFACPDCHGVLWEIKDGQLLRFRCRVGHAYTADALRLAMSDASEDALWIALRTLEEKAALLRRLAARSQSRMGDQYSDEASGFEKHAQTIRDLLVENQSLRAHEDDQSGAA